MHIHYNYLLGFFLIRMYTGKAAKNWKMQKMADQKRRGEGFWQNERESAEEKRNKGNFK